MRRLHDKDVTGEIERLVAGQSLLATIALELTTSDDFSTKIHIILKEVGEFLNVSRVYIFENDDRLQSTSNTFEWCNENIHPEIENLQNIPYETIRPWLDIIEQEGMICAEHIEDLSKEVYDILGPQGVISILIYKLQLHGEVTGFVGFDECTAPRMWQADELKILKVISGIICSVYEHESLHARITKQEENFRSFFNSMQDFIFIGDMQGHIVHTNTAVQERLTVPESADGQVHILDYHPPEYREEASRLLHEMLQGRLKICPLPLIGKTGEHIPVETHVWVDTWNGEQSVFGISKDRSLQQAALERFDKIFHDNPSAMFVSDFSTLRIADVNHSFETVTGYSRDAAIGSTVQELVHFASQKVYEEVIRELSERGEVHDVRIEVKTRNALKRLVLLLSSTRINNQGTRSYLTVMQDITEQEAAREQLSNQKYRMENIIEATNVGTWEWDIISGRTQFNERWAQIIGYGLEELGETTINTWIGHLHPEDIEHSKNELERHFAGLSPMYTCECRMQHRNGEYIWILDAGRVVSWDDQGNPLVMFGTHTDITTRKLIEQQLVTEKLKAEHADQSKSNFLAMVSHEIRTPIHTMIGYQNLLSMTTLDSRQRRYVGRLFNSSQVLLNTVTNILDFSKIEAQRIELEQTEFSLDTAVNSLIEIFSGRIARKKIEFFVSVDPEIPDLLIGDSFRFLQVLQNLLSNAEKFTHKGSISLRIRCKELTSSAVTLECSVIDTGIGIDETTRERLFTAFMQADESITRKYGGTGLGLAMCRSLTELMGGTIRLESILGKGSVFTAVIPFTIAGTISGNPPDRAGFEQLHLAGYFLSDAHKAYISRICSYYHMSWSWCDRSDSLQPETDRQVVSVVDWEGFIGKSENASFLNFFDRDTRPMVIISSILINEHDIEVILREHSYVLVHKPFLKDELLDALLMLEHRMSSTLSQAAELADQVVEYTTAPTDGESRRMTVLICEDHLVNRLMLEELLRVHGYDVIGVDNGISAITYITERPIDLLLLDIQMPGIDGFETARRIRGLSGGYNTGMPILFLTADVLAQSRAAEMGLEQAKFITKPIEPVPFLKTIEQELCGREAQQRKAEKQDRSSIDLVDANQGIHRFSDDEHSYYRFLANFLAKNQDMSSIISEMIRNEQHAGLLSYVHNIRGVALNLGLKELSRSLLQFEQQLHLDQDGYAELEDELRLVFDQIALEITRVLDAVQEVSPDQESQLGGLLTEPIDARSRHAIRSICTSLSEVLMHNELNESTRLLEQLQQQPLTEQLAIQAGLAADDIRAYQFEEAVGHIQCIIEQIT